MKKLLKVTAILLLIFIVLGGIGIGVFFHNIDSIAKRHIEDGATQALGVRTTVSSVSLHVFAGELAISKVKIENPQGFASPHFITLKKGRVVVTLDSLNKEIVEVPKLTLSDIDLNLERSSSGSNYDRIIENLRKLKGSSPPSGSEKRFIIGNLTIENISIHADLLGAPGVIGQIVSPVGKVNLPIERIELKDIGKAGVGSGGSGVTMKELSKIVVQAVLAAAAEKGYGTLPGEILNDLKSAATSFDGLVNLPVAVVGRSGEAVTMIGGVVENVGKTAGDAINSVGKGITDAIGGLLGGKDDKKDEKKNPPKNP